MPEPKPKCPKCGVEIEGTPEECAKCHFKLAAFGDFFDLFSVAAKKLRADEEAEAEKNKPKKQTTMDYILGRKAK